MPGSESDVPADDKVSRSRDTGGDDEHRGYEEETGAEARAEG